MESYLGKRKLEEIPLELLDLPASLVLERILWYACVEEELWDVLKLRLVCRKFLKTMDALVINKLLQYFPQPLIYGPTHGVITPLSRFGMSLTSSLVWLRRRFPGLKFKVYYAPPLGYRGNLNCLVDIPQVKLEPDFTTPDKIDGQLLKSVERLTLLNVDPFPVLPVFLRLRKLSMHDCTISNDKAEKEISRTPYVKLKNCSYFITDIFGPHHDVIKIEKARLGSAVYFKNVRRVKLCDIELLSDVSPLKGVYSLTLVNCENIADVSPLSEVPHLTLRRLPKVTDVSMLTGVKRLKLIDVSSLYSLLECTSLQVVKTLIVFSRERWAPEVYVKKGFTHLHYYSMRHSDPSSKWFTTRRLGLPTCESCRDQENALFLFTHLPTHHCNITFHWGKDVERALKRSGGSVKKPHNWPGNRDFSYSNEPE